MKRLAFVVLTALFTLSIFSACLAADEASPASPAESSGWKFDRKIIIVCPWGEGGGADSTLRALIPLLKDSLGQEIEVQNVTGNGGVNGASFTRERAADGYTFMLGTQSLFAMDVQGAMPFKFKDEFVPVARLVNAINIIAASRKAMEERGYNNFSEMREFVKSHPFSISVGMLTSAGVDGISMRQALEGLNVLEVSYPNGASMNDALKAGQIDMMITGTDEIDDLIAAGDIKPLLALSEKKMNLYPTIEAAGEVGVKAFLGPERGIFAKKGTPQGAIDAMSKAIEEATKSDSWKEFLILGAYDERPGFAPASEYQKIIDDEYKTFTDMLKPAKDSKKAAPKAAPSPKLAVIGFIMVLVLIICLIKKIVIPPIAFILLPTIAALVAGFDPLVINKFAASGISKMVSTVSLFVFSISFFSLMSDQGVFDPVVNFLIKKAGTNVTAVLCATAAVAVIGHLDGSGATTFIITITAMLPLFKKLKMDNRALMMLVCVAIGVMNVCPWGGPTIRAATVLETDPNNLWHRLLPVQGAMLVITFVVAFLQSGIQKRRIKKLGLTADDSAVDTTTAKADDKPKVSSALQWYNFLVVVAVIVILMMGLLNPAYTFMLALALTLPFNIKSLKEQNGKLKNYGVAAMSMVVTLFAAGIFTGVLSGTGMLNAMASAVVTVIPPDLGRYTHFIVACFAVPLIMCLGTDSFYFGLLPVVVGIASQFGVNPMDVACVLLVAENVGVMISPLSPAMYLGLGLLEIDVGEHIKYSLAWIWGVSILAIAACIVLGVTPL